jgi:ABC-type transporter Mla MlaB component
MIFGSHYEPVGLGSLEPGTHLCALDPIPDRLDRAAATFVGQGLAAGDQLLYVGSVEQADVLLDLLPDAARARHALATGQLLVRSFEEAYGSSRPDDLGTIAAGFRAAADQARKSGFPGLRVAAWMDQLAPFLGSVEEVVRWEHASTELQREIAVTSVNLYDASRLGEHDRALIAGAHTGAAPERADAPIATFVPVLEPWGLQVSGEVDLSNRDLLLRLVQSRAAVEHRLRLDLGELRFVDVGTLAGLCHIADRLPEDGYLLLDRVPQRVRRLIEIAGLGHERLQLG